MSAHQKAEEAPSVDTVRSPSRPLLIAALAGLLGASGCDSDAPTRRILTSVVDPDVTLESFTLECDERGGTVEQHAHCGGANSCHGFSYDTDTDVLTEHTCQGLNTCTGFSCVVPDEG